MSTVRLNGVDLVRMAGGRGGAPAVEPVAAEIPAGSGGTIETARGRLTIPPGALRADTSITMQDEGGPTAAIRFGPSGLTFDRPARLAIRVGGLEVETADRLRLRIAGASDGGGDWRVIGGEYDAETGLVEVGIDRFSQYALCLE